MSDRKRVLLVGPRFFGYEQEISDAMREAGLQVDYHDERPGNDFFTKLLIRFAIKSPIRRRIHDHYNRIAAESADKTYSHVLFVVPETVPLDWLAEFKRTHRSAKFIVYMWDSFENKEHARKLLPYFDQVYTFDLHDASTVPGARYLPLFYSNKLLKCRSSSEREYDVSFVGTVHSDRYAFLSSIRKQADAAGLRSYFYLYLQSPVLYWVQKMFNKDWKRARIGEFHFTPLSKESVANIISQSRSVIDIQHPSQTGLTIRSLEVIGAGRKLLTTNPAIKAQRFYDSHTMQIVDRTNPQIDLDFVREKVKIHPHPDIEDLVLHRWIETVLSERIEN